jgi:hypothetical protein
MLLGARLLIPSLSKLLLALSVYASSHSDAQNLAEMTGIPSIAWALGRVRFRYGHLA